MIHQVLDNHIGWKFDMQIGFIGFDHLIITTVAMATCFHVFYHKVGYFLFLSLATVNIHY